MPAGNYLTGDLCLRTGVTLHLLRDAHLLGSRDPEDYDHLLADELEPLPQAGHSDAPGAAPSLEPDADCAFYTGDDCIAGTDNLNMLARDCQINTACASAAPTRCSRNAAFSARCLFRGSLTDEKKRSGQVRSAGGHRYNMLSLLIYYVDRLHPIRYTPGNIVIRDCTGENADRFLHYDFSGNEPWQCGRPLSGVTFEKVRTTGIRHPLHAYGAPEEPFSLTLRDCSLEFAADVHPALVWAANWAMLSLTRVSVRGLGDCALIKAWSDSPTPRLQACDLGAFRGELLRQADEPFVCAAI